MLAVRRTEWLRTDGFSPKPEFIRVMCERMSELCFAGILLRAAGCGGRTLLPPPPPPTTPIAGIPLSPPTCRPSSDRTPARPERGDSELVLSPGKCLASWLKILNHYMRRCSSENLQHPVPRFERDLCKQFERDRPMQRCTCDAFNSSCSSAKWDLCSQ